ncbi:MAG: hypothetical protein MUC68_13470 [Burkholderiaceae bacterium]|nr:hypothetical protein [Burkholderiaceae bacterium]
MPATLRNRTAGACFAIALEHHEAVTVLAAQAPPLYSSAFALVRPTYESCLRGMWLSHCATEEQVKSFSMDCKVPDMASLAQAVENAGDLNRKQLSGIYAKHWSAFCSYTHSGGLHAQRWNTPDAIESNFSDDEVREVLQFTSAMALLAAIGVATLASNEVLARELLEAARVYAAT